MIVCLLLTWGLNTSCDYRSLGWNEIDSLWSFDVYLCIHCDSCTIMQRDNSLKIMEKLLMMWIINQITKHLEHVHFFCSTEWIFWRNAYVYQGNPPMKSLNIYDNEANIVVQLNNIWWSKPFITYFNTLIEEYNAESAQKTVFFTSRQ